MWLNSTHCTFKIHKLSVKPASHENRWPVVFVCVWMEACFFGTNHIHVFQWIQGINQNVCEKPIINAEVALFFLRQQSVTKAPEPHGLGLWCSQKTFWQQQTVSSCLYVCSVKTTFVLLFTRIVSFYKWLLFKSTTILSPAGNASFHSPIYFPLFLMTALMFFRIRPIKGSSNHNGWNWIVWILPLFGL